MNSRYMTGLFFAFLCVVKPMAQGEDEEVSLITKKILDSLEPETFNGQGIDDEESLKEEDQELLESIAEARNSLQDANENLEQVGKRYMLKIHRPWCNVQQTCMQFRGRRRWQSCTCPNNSVCRKVGSFWKSWKCV